MSRKVSNEGGAAPKLGTLASFLVGLGVLGQNAVTGVPRLTVTRGNRKISSLCAIFSVFPPVTCPRAGVCLLFCYYFKVLKGLRGVVLAAVESNFQATLRDDFVDRMVAELQKLQDKYGILAVRLHDGGDLYSQSYIQKCVEIAKRLPYLVFFCFTKSLHLDLAPLEQLPNFVLIKSFGGLDDDKINTSTDNYAVVAADVNEAKRRASLVGGEVCPPELLGLKLSGPNRGVWCGIKCTLCMQKDKQIKVFFVQENDGWNGVPPEAIERIKALDRHGLLKPENSVQQRRLDDFRRKYVAKGGVSP